MLFQYVTPEAKMLPAISVLPLSLFHQSMMPTRRKGSKANCVAERSIICKWRTLVQPSIVIGWRN